MRRLGKLFWTLLVGIVVAGMTVWGMGAFSYAVHPVPLSSMLSIKTHKNQMLKSAISRGGLQFGGHISTMKNLTASFMTVAVFSMIVFSHCHSYAFSYEIKTFPFRLLKNDEISFSNIDIYNNNFAIDAKNNTDEQGEDNLRSNT